MTTAKRQFKNIEIDREDDKYIYLLMPYGIRVNKITKDIEKVVRGKFELVKEGIQNGAPVIYACDKFWVKGRILAELFVPNPEGFKRVVYKDGNKMNISIDNLGWGGEERAKRSVTTSKQRSEALGGLRNGTKEYWKKYNHVVGTDGLTNVKRFVQRNKELGYVHVLKKFSPTGKSFWCSPILAAEIRNAARRDMFIIDSVRESFIERIKAEVQRKNKWYTDRKIQ